MPSILPYLALAAAKGLAGYQVGRQDAEEREQQRRRQMIADALAQRGADRADAQQRFSQGMQSANAQLGAERAGFVSDASDEDADVMRAAAAAPGAGAFSLPDEGAHAVASRMLAQHAPRVTVPTADGAGVTLYRDPLGTPEAKAARAAALASATVLPRMHGIVQKRFPDVTLEDFSALDSPSRMAMLREAIQPAPAWHPTTEGEAVTYATQVARGSAEARSAFRAPPRPRATPDPTRDRGNYVLRRIPELTRPRKDPKNPYLVAPGMSRDDAIRAAGDEYDAARGAPSADAGGGAVTGAGTTVLGSGGTALHRGADGRALTTAELDRKRSMWDAAAAQLRANRQDPGAALGPRP